MKQRDHELEDWLSEFDIEYPDDEKIEQTIMQLHQYVPKKKQSRWKRIIPAPLRNAFLESLYASKSFWISNLVYLAIGLSFVLLMGGDPYMTLFCFAPLPVLIAMMEIFRSRDAGLIELELSLKFSPSDLIISKLTIVGMYNLACNLLLIIIFNFFAEPIILIQLLKYWALPYCVVIALCLFLSIKFKAVFAAPIAIAGLFTLCFTVFQLDTVYEAIPNFLMTIALICMIIVIGFLMKMIKRGVYHEFNN